MYSIIEQGGFQFTVTPGATILVPLVAGDVGSEIPLGKVLLTADGDNVRVGTPFVKDASVTAKVLGHVKGEKVLIVKKKRRKRYQRKTGHRQQYTRVQIVSINA